MSTPRPIPSALTATVALCLLLAGPTPRGRATETVTAPVPVSVEPLFSGGADDPGQAARERVHAIARAAEERLWLFAYTLTDRGLLEILAEKAAAPAFDLRILVDGEEHASALADADPDGPAALVRDLARKGRLIPVALRDGRLHTKLLLVDGAVLVAGSENWSNLGARTKWNDLLVVHDAKGAAVAACERAFLAIPEARGFGPARRLARRRPNPTSALAAADGAHSAALAVSLCAPGGGRAPARERLLGLVRGARRQVKVAQFTLTDVDLVQALLDAARRGVEVQVVVDRTQHANLDQRGGAAAKALRDRLDDLARAGALRVAASGPQLHHKLAVIDDAVVTGSANWTPSAWTENHEVVLFVSAAPRKPATFVDAYLARHAALWEAGARP